MKNTKKILGFTIIPILIILIIVCMHFIFREKLIISSPYTVSEVERTITENSSICEYKSTSDNWVALLDVSYKGEDVTDEIDANEFIKLLSTNKCKYTFKTYSPYNADEVIWEINLVYNNKSIHILIGNFNVLYESAHEGFYEILEADLLKQSLEKMVFQN